MSCAGFRQVLSALPQITNYADTRGVSSSFVSFALSALFFVVFFRVASDILCIARVMKFSDAADNSLLAAEMVYLEGIRAFDQV